MGLIYFFYLLKHIITVLWFFRQVTCKPYTIIINVYVLHELYVIRWSCTTVYCSTSKYSVIALISLNIIGIGLTGSYGENQNSYISDRHCVGQFKQINGIQRAKSHVIYGFSGFIDRALWTRSKVTRTRETDRRDSDENIDIHVPSNI